MRQARTADPFLQPRIGGVVTEKFRFQEMVNLRLHRDEAIVLLWYLSRELDEDNLRDSFIHAAESHSLHALLQEVIPALIDTGAPETAGIEVAAREHLLQRHL
jgi:hypothetical protein